jgi:transcriptional regulator with XRE-family HTH domain
MTNEEIGKLIGLSHSGVSRLRRGERLPSIDVMVAIATHFDWSVADQVKTRSTRGARAYAAVFNDKIDVYDTPKQRT